MPLELLFVSKEEGAVLSKKEETTLSKEKGGWMLI
jgi:hypothetical protein